MHTRTLIYSCTLITFTHPYTPTPTHTHPHTHTQGKDGPLPKTECLKDCVARFLPWFNSVCIPSMKAGKKVLIAAHGNSLRALVKHLDNLSDEEICGLNIPTAIPLVYKVRVPTSERNSGRSERMAADLHSRIT